jgi:hypothetical protein
MDTDAIYNFELQRQFNSPKVINVKKNNRLRCADDEKSKTFFASLPEEKKG